MTPEHCLICGDKACTPVHRYDAPDSYERSAGVEAEGYARMWVRCSGCGFHYSRYSRDGAVLGHLYEQGYRDMAASWRGQTTEETFRKVIALPSDQSETKTRVAWVKKNIDEMMAAGLLDWPAPPWSMVDIGGASGVFAYEFKDDRWSTMIVDPAAEGRFVESWGVTYRQNAYAPGTIEKQAHLAALVYTLEHMREPAKVLSALRSDLVPGGALFVEVPDAAAFGRKPADDDIFNSCHLWMFDPPSILRLLSGAGFDVLSLKRTKTLRGHFSLMVLAKTSS